MHQQSIEQYFEISSQALKSNPWPALRKIFVKGS